MIGIERLLKTLEQGALRTGGDVEEWAFGPTATREGDGAVQRAGCVADHLIVPFAQHDSKRGIRNPSRRFRRRDELADPRWSNRRAKISVPQRRAMFDVRLQRPLHDLPWLPLAQRL